MEGDNFYKEQTFKLLMDEIGELKKGQIAMAKDITEIKGKMQWMWGWAAGIAIAVSVGWQFISSKVRGH